MVMSGASLLMLLLVALICGALGRAIAGGTRGGLLTSIALGFIGAIAGSWMGHALHLADPLIVRVGGRPFPLLWSILGAAVIVLLLHMITARRSSMWI
jgi:uncharacterized membrane protein YeaQ/YmgE (transglycosylase-associated protein family)